MSDVIDYAYIRKLVRDRSGIVLEERQNYLIDSRLDPVAKAEGFPDLLKFSDFLKTNPVNGLHQKVVEAMTTNETYFFRDIAPFDVLKNNLIPQFVERRAAIKELKIWSAACSTGQELYSIAMIINENFPLLKSWKVELSGSDLSLEILKKAREGRFGQIEVNRGLPAIMLVKYFEKWGIDWKIKDEIKSMVNFFPINLTDTWPSLPTYDVIFLRNVMIYFDVEDKKKILASVKRHLAKDGYLFLGGAESTMNLDNDFQRCDFERAGCYQLKQG